MKKLYNSIPRSTRILIGCVTVGFAVWTFTPGNAFNNWYLTLPEGSRLRYNIAQVIIYGIFLCALPLTIIDIINLIKDLRRRKAEDAGKKIATVATFESPFEMWGLLYVIIVVVMMIIGTVNMVMEEGPLALFFLIIPLFVMSVPVFFWLDENPKRRVEVEGDTVTEYYFFKKPYTFKFRDVKSIPMYIHPDDWVDTEDDIPCHIFSVVTKDKKTVNIGGGRDLYYHVKDMLEREVPDACPWLPRRGRGRKGKRGR